MPIDKRQKHKKKREEKRKAKRHDAERQQRAERAEEYFWRAEDAYYRRKEYREALSWALKKVDLDSDEAAVDLALNCLVKLKDSAASRRVLERFYRQGLLIARQNHLVLASLAASGKDYRLAADVFQSLISDHAAPRPRLQGALTKAKWTEIGRALKYYEQLAEITELAKSGFLKGAPRGGPAASNTDSRASASNARAEAGDDSATDSGRAVTASAALPQGAGSQETASLPKLDTTFEADAEPVLAAIRDHRRADRATFDLTIRAFKLSFRTSYDQLICLPTLRSVSSFWYQEETARKILKIFRGRAILADEVGLGKTIEAGLVIKEYLMRGLVHTALVLAPSSLVSQWQEELAAKFDLPFASTADPMFKQDPERFWSQPFVLASLQTARGKRHFDAITARSYDIVVVDEAHHLKNRTTLNWKLVNAIQKTFLLMLTATPVQNSLEELYNLVTLLRPGHLKTLKAFKDQFVTRGDPTDPRNREALRQLLREVMVRNTRSVTRLQLPPRFATTVRIAPRSAEQDFYAGVSSFVTELSGNGAAKIPKITLRKLLEAAGSSHAAALRMLDRMREGSGFGREGRLRITELIDMAGKIRRGSKLQKVIELIQASPDQKVLFVNHLATIEYLETVLREEGIPHTVYHGGLNAARKQSAMEDFRGGRQVLLATGSGGEGHNLQFCHVLLNYDLPWNPMEIEQRIGRLHRIGQEHEVQVYNFCAAGSIEDRILDILDRKINMFELVVGEIDMILGRLQGEEEFGDLIYEIWVKNSDETDRQKAYNALAVRLRRARGAYEKSKELDEKLFQEDFGV
jgi:superfamily II DNA or RNA helicase